MTKTIDILKRLTDEFTCDDCGDVVDVWCGRCYCCETCCTCPVPNWAGPGALGAYWEPWPDDDADNAPPIEPEGE
jgi:hypothetical protein